MKKQIVDLLTAYLMGWKTVRDCGEFIASIDWDAGDLNGQTKELIGELELIITEVLEDLRPESELWTRASEIIAQETDSVYVIQAPKTDFVVINSSNDSYMLPGIMVEEGVVGSQFWNISPQLESV